MGCPDCPSTNSHDLRSLGPAPSSTELQDTRATAARLNRQGCFFRKALPSTRAGNVIIADTYNFRVRKVTPDRQITTIAGVGFMDTSEEVGADNKPATSTPLHFLTDVAVDASGNVFFSEGRGIGSAGSRLTVTCAWSLVGGDWSASAARGTWPCRRRCPHHRWQSTATASCTGRTPSAIGCGGQTMLPHRCSIFPI